MIALGHRNIFRCPLFVLAEILHITYNRRCCFEEDNIGALFKRFFAAFYIKENVLF